MSNSHDPAILPRALQQTQEAQEKIEAGARDLFVANEVLKQELPPPVKADEDVAVALEKSEAVQNNLETVVEKLDDVGKALAQEVARRKVAERQLKETKADLADTQAKLDDANGQS